MLLIAKRHLQERPSAQVRRCLWVYPVRGCVTECVAVMARHGGEFRRSRTNYAHNVERLLLGVQWVGLGVSVFVCNEVQPGLPLVVG